MIVNIAAQRQKNRTPAGFGSGAATGLQGQQIRMAHERRGIGLRLEQRIPRCGIDLGSAVVQLQCERWSVGGSAVTLTIAVAVAVAVGRMG